MEVRALKQWEVDALFSAAREMTSEEKDADYDLDDPDEVNEVWQE